MTGCPRTPASLSPRPWPWGARAGGPQQARRTAARPRRGHRPPPERQQARCTAPPAEGGRRSLPNNHRHRHRHHQPPDPRARRSCGPAARCRAAVGSRWLRLARWRSARSRSPWSGRRAPSSHRRGSPHPRRGSGPSGPATRSPTTGCPRTRPRHRHLRDHRPCHLLRDLCHRSPSLSCCPCADSSPRAHQVAPASETLPPVRLELFHLVFVWFVDRKMVRGTFGNPSLQNKCFFSLNGEAYSTNSEV